MTIDYLAGFFDGEGCITVAINRTPGEKIKRGTPGKVYVKYSLSVQLTNTDRSTLDYCQERWGGHVYLQSKSKNSHRRDCFVWRVNGKKSIPFLTDIKGHLRQKNKQADLALEFVNLPPTHNVEKRAELCDEIRWLNNSPQSKPRGY